MPDEVVAWLTLAAAALAFCLALLGYLAARTMRAEGPNHHQMLGRLLREESDRVCREGGEQARAARQEVDAALRGFHQASVKMHTDFGELLTTRVDQFAGRLDAAARGIDDKVAAIGGKLDVDMARMGSEAAQNRDALRLAIEAKLDESGTRQHRATADTRQELTGSFQALKAAIGDTLGQMGGQQKERLDGATAAIATLIEKHERGQESLRLAVEGRLDTLRTENSAKLEEMRATVDEKLKTTLDTRLGESFNRVVEQLERVHKGIGEMQSLATNVGDLRNVLTNVKVRGTFGEVQLGLLIEDVLAPEQFIRDARVKANSAERVEFAIRMPRKQDDPEILLPIDAKFPREDYDRLQEAGDSGDARLVAHFRKELEKRIRACAKDISEKYINPPLTTEMAIMFLPSEGLYAEVLRQPALVESVHRDCRVMIAGPTTLQAILNACRAMYRTAAIEQRSTEVWHVLGAVKSEFAKYNSVVEKIEKQLQVAVKSVDTLGVRTRAMTRTLKSVESQPDAIAAETLLGLEAEAIDALDADDDLAGGPSPKLIEPPGRTLLDS